ncbi:maleylpyruvate isomerase family mycothiol-dependent enzyme [Planomonospora sp. ID67723]|uniref:maleylpyruvate isomerase family mycothiol-dependent enzyme n=1 Tax=Planomonospora sp. ID67723 TaxID=2738134 RepID=UPI0018C3C916|nr:maleylpyruvate isomerase family mycothiol-dependent enzyme [Planomonospora sp. ID67723]MBG0832447.1 maleylpyruvate isomerase family mycothiol-dependent enzyme [Planomonospora sp. ID67723]
MKISDHVVALQDAGSRLVEAAARAGLDAPVPTCPGWRVRDLLGHVGGVHRWAAAHVATARAEPFADDEKAAFFSAPDDDGLLDWFRAGHGALVRTLEDADPGVTCWTFLRAPSPLAFWARRQAHETAIHRIDAESAAGDVTSLDPALAADGVDELFGGFLPRRRGRLVSDPPVSLAVQATDHPTAWTIRVEPDGRTITQGLHEADCVVTGPATGLYLLLWNRAGVEGLDVRGDRSVLALWREKATITWG